MQELASCKLDESLRVIYDFRDTMNYHPEEGKKTYKIRSQDDSSIHFLFDNTNDFN